MITLPKLITVAPFSEEIKKDLLDQVDTFSATKKFELEEMCWGLISQWYHDEMQVRSEVAALEMAKGKKSYTKEELEKIPEELFHELAEKLESSSSEEAMQEVREKLTKINQ